jgi:site-specific recombinase XerD
MSFNEEQFRHLVDGTRKTVIALGTTSEAVLRKHRKVAEMLVEYLTKLDTPFERDICLQWVDSMEHDPASTLSSSYVEWIAYRRFVMLLAEQEAGTLTSWTHYQSREVEMPKSKDFVGAITLYRAFLTESGLHEQTAYSYSRCARWLLMYLEAQGVARVSDIQNADIAGYFVSPRFEDKAPKGIQTEASALRNFTRFLVENGYNSRETLHYAIPQYRVSVQKIVTTLTPEMVSDIMEDEPESLVDKRDKAVCLLALHIGLRSGDIRNLKFGDIDWDEGVLSVKQGKTGADLLMPLDNETQNAIIDYVLNERRDCQSEHIFVTAVGPAQKMARRHFRIKHRASSETIPHDGLHIFRRTFASRLLQSGTPLEMISEMLGHTDRASVQCYLSTDDAKMKRCALDLSAIPYLRGDF